MKVQPCKRWSVVYNHDGQPVDGWQFVHKRAATRRAEKKPDVYRVEQVCIIAAETMDEILKRLP